jgi:NADH:ubiquinone oxidoreductase subunit F (NADH-binding)
MGTAKEEEQQTTLTANEITALAAIIPVITEGVAKYNERQTESLKNTKTLSLHGLYLRVGIIALCLGGIIALGLLHVINETATATLLSGVIGYAIGNECHK